MRYKNILFDLDGTLLPMDLDVFTGTYFGLLYKKIQHLGYEKESFIKTMWEGTGAMMMNDGSRRNDEAFWDVFCKRLGEERLADLPVFDEFYAKEFNETKAVCGYNPLAAEIVHRLNDMGVKVVLATNPFFPMNAIVSRLDWIGLKTDDFVCCTTYDSNRFCKPNPKYFEDLLNRLGMKPEECLMVGNDATEDTCGEVLGIQTFLITDNLINKHNVDIDRWPHGTFEDLKTYLFEE